VASSLFSERTGDFGLESARSRRIQAVERPSFADLYRRHFEFVWRVLWRGGVGDAQIPDLVHDVFVVVLRKLSTYAHEGPAEGNEDQERRWIYRITVYEMKNHRARRRHRREELTESAGEALDPRDEAERVADREHLRILLNSTTPERATVFELVELEGFTVAEAARTLEVPETTATKRLRLARRDVHEAARRLERRERDAGKTRKNGVYLLPFGVGAWLDLRKLLAPPAGAAAHVWARLRTSLADVDRAGDRPATPPRPSSRRAPIGQLLKVTLGYVATAVAGAGAATAVLLARPTARIAIFRVPGPVVIADADPSPPSGAPAPSAVAPPPVVLPSGTGTLLDPEELRLLRQAQAAHTC
jgi:RNA polymerase sigma-70 factor, ECF subfamily